MSAYEWTPDLSVGDAEIDHDHRELFRLFHLLEGGDPSEDLLGDIIGRLESYARTHFDREEALLRQYGYPDFDEHVKGHRLFIEWLDAVRNTYARSVETPFEIGATVNQFLGEWLVHHVQHEDLRYRDFIAAHKGGDE
ncbi:MAG: hypothetical protein VR70_11545 [Rhodospirillaceae bacterium BRH_c57]|nr:MAG: hypothetical protein VR70_11545 [Rhodospirillaceae bacterium BRH_c57]